MDMRIFHRGLLPKNGRLLLFLSRKRRQPKPATRSECWFTIVLLSLILYRKRKVSSQMSTKSAKAKAPPSKRGGLKLNWNSAASTTTRGDEVKEKKPSPDEIYSVNHVSGLAGDSGSGDDASASDLKPSTSASAARKNNKVCPEFNESDYDLLKHSGSCCNQGRQDAQVQRGR